LSEDKKRPGLGDEYLPKREPDLFRYSGDIVISYWWDEMVSLFSGPFASHGNIWPLFIAEGLVNVRVKTLAGQQHRGAEPASVQEAYQVWLARKITS
jgi:hypothetical protein